MERERIVLLGAAGRDFHNFNVVYRNDPQVEVVAFTATQIPHIEDRRYPAVLAGPLYPAGIPIVAEAELEQLVTAQRIDRVILAYSDLAHADVMHLGSRALAAGADFSLLGPRRTMLQARVPVIAVCAVRTGAGKSQTARYVVRHLKQAGRRVVVVRHPMPYGKLADQRVERLASYGDLDRYRCTIEEREEYEAHITGGAVVYAGVDYEPLLRQAEAEADLLVWDGGNNDLPFFRPDLWIVVADPLRAGHELGFHPGEANFRAADVIVINKVTNAPAESVAAVAAAAARVNPRATVVRGASELSVDQADRVRGQRVLIVEDGPTLTHGGMAYGAGQVAATQLGAAAIVDPRQFAVGSIRDTFERYPHIGPVLPAMGYYDAQLGELEATIRAASVACDVVLVATPIDLGRLIRIPVPAVHVRYELRDLSSPTLAEALAAFAK